jgi:hypothetical protein
MSFVKDVVAARHRMFIDNQINWLYVDLKHIYRHELAGILNNILNIKVT